MGVGFMRRNLKTLNTNQIHRGDAVAGMKTMEGDSVDLIITDPPFAIDFKASRSNYNRTGSLVLNGYHEIAKKDYLDFSKNWMREAHRLLKPTGSAFVFSGWNNLKDILIAADDIGFITTNHIIWKYQFGVFCKRRFVTSHYHCLFLCKDEKARRFFPSSRFSQTEKTENGGSSRYRDMEDVWTIKREYWTGKTKTPTKLPSELISKCLAYASQKGDLVLDPFMGSGQVAYVAREEGRRYIGFEIVKDYADFARKRLQKPTKSQASNRLCKQPESRKPKRSPHTTTSRAPKSAARLSR